MVLAFFVLRPVRLLPANLPPEVDEVVYAALPAEEDEHPAMEMGEMPDCHSLEAPASVYVTVRSPNLAEDRIDIHWKALFMTADFWLLFTTMSLLSGTGLMYINNVGSMVQALLAHENSEYDQVASLKLQSQQVSYISLCSFGGRITIGIIADVLKNRFRFPRSFVLMIVASSFLASQVILYRISAVRSIWQASVFLGASYGMLFGIFPTLVIEWFGLAHFSENWGFNLDAHTPHFDSEDDSGSRLQRLEDRLCYKGTIQLTILACCASLALTAYASWKDWKRTLTAISP